MFSSFTRHYHAKLHLFPSLRYMQHYSVLWEIWRNKMISKLNTIPAVFWPTFARFRQFTNPNQHSVDFVCFGEHRYGYWAPKIDQCKGIFFGVFVRFSHHKFRAIWCCVWICTHMILSIFLNLCIAFS